MAGERCPEITQISTTPMNQLRASLLTDFSQHMQRGFTYYECLTDYQSASHTGGFLIYLIVISQVPVEMLTL